MASTFSPNLNLELVGRNDQVGIWDTPENSDWSIVDRSVGGITTIGLNNSPVVLSGAQFQSKQITFNSTLTGNVAITFPTSFTKSYEIQHLCTGSSAFVITLQTTAGGQVICCPPGQTIDCFNDGANIKFKNFGPPVGGYWDYAGSSNPAWNTGCTVPPYLNCDGSAIPAAYTVLPVILGSSLLPDSRGRSRFAIDQAAGRISSAATGFSGSSVGSGGGAQTTTLSSQNMPPIPITDPGHTHAIAGLYAQFSAGGSNAGSQAGAGYTTPAAAAAQTGITAGSSSPTSMTNLPPAYIGGLTLIRSA